MNKFLEQLKDSPETIEFEHCISIIDNNYQFTATEFSNAGLLNKANQNNGSCKIFAFAKLHQLTEQQTLNCFGQYYRQDVLLNPNNNDHQNIRNFIKSGWSGISFKSSALS